MNEFNRTLSRLPELREKHGEQMDKLFVSLLLLSKELDIELDGVSLPGAASAIINRFRSLMSDYDRWTNE